MPETGFHFAQPWWLLALLLPALVYLWLKLTAPRHDTDRYRAYADRHLLPLLLGRQELQTQRRWRRFALWTALWSLLTIALAGPRWDYTDMQLFRPGSDLVILLDLSRSMEVTDVAPNRLARARQEIEDLINNNRHARIGLIAFATVAHVVSPLTEDGNTVRLQLPSLSTQLVQLKGSRLTEALVRAGQLLAGQPEDSSRHILVVSDGDFADQNLDDQVRKLTARGIFLHVLGIGTAEGGQVPGPGGRNIRNPRGGGDVVSRLDENGLKHLAELGKGVYRAADYRDSDIDEILALVGRHADAEIIENEKARVWNERFFWLVGLAMLGFMPMFRRVRPSTIWRTGK